MKFLAILLISTLLISSTLSVSLRKSSKAQANQALDKLKKLSNSSPYAKNLVSTIELQLQSGDKTDEVVDLIEKALAETQTSRDRLHNEYTQEMARLQGIIDTNNDRLADLKQQLATANANIASLKDRISTLNNTIDTLTNTLSALDTREAEVRESRANDLKAFNERQARDTNTIEALETILPKLNELKAQGPQQNYGEELVELASMTPLEAFVQVSSKFDVETLDNVIGKLNAILEASKASKADDQAKEIQAEARFNELINEIETTRAAKQLAKQNAETELEEKENALDLEETTRDNLETNIENTTNLINDTIETKNTSDANYTQKIAYADDAIEALGLARDIVNESIEEFKSRENYNAEIDGRLSQ